MDIFQSIFLGIVQGLTEFLPISSSGHLVIFQELLGVEQHSIAFDVAAHLGTVLTVITLYFATVRQMLWEVITYPSHRRFTPGIKLMLLIVVGSVPTAIIGLSLKDMFESLFSNLLAVGIFLTITGLILFLTRNKARISRHIDVHSLEDVKAMHYWQAALIGVAQGMAIAPGISRSGSTIAAGLALGIDRKTTALFSFMLSLPAIMGAGLLQLRHITSWDHQVLLSLGVGFLTAYLSGLMGLWGILYFVKKGRLEYFSYYLWVVGPAVIFWSL
ncbi:MAG: undecaprenyl-diphosphate phosphatase [Pseudobdellovibrionaceae bacterium]|mgnify:CR=1 FL=1|nr:undecaprenyl-diphosphate phosphatase [Bdellovibrionales bacterium]USN46975.1 MAG: undecaprenyl-diphosphate phosphatase [Pseudobdellovibrionaceae bacterium]